MFIHEVCEGLRKARVPYAVVGGYAVALHGVPRGTLDIDFVIRWSLKNLEHAEKAMRGLGLVSRIPVDAGSVFHFREEYIQNRHLIAWNFYDPRNPSRQVDIIITFDLAKLPTKTLTTASGKITVLAKKELIQMKKKSGRLQDLEDVKSLEAL